MNLCDISPIDRNVVYEALNSGAGDFEDAVQCFSSKIMNADIIISRDKKEFADQDCIVMTPQEFVARCKD